MPPLLRDNRIVVYLFIGLRIMLLLAYEPLSPTASGVTTFGDFQHYYNLAALHKLPYRDYWYEFPPVFPIISLTVFGIVDARGSTVPGADFGSYAIVLALVMLAFDTGNLLIIRIIGTKIHNEGTGQALAWVYAVLAVPLVFSYWTFEPIVAFAVLAVLLWLIEQKDNRSALVTAFGALTKFMPLVMLGPVWRFRPLRDAIRFTVISLGVTALGLVAMLAIAGPFGIPSLTAQFSKASYESIWALIDKNYKTGNFGPDADHFDPAKASELLGNPPVIPSWVRGIIFGALGLLIYARTRRFDNKGMVAFTAITITLFFLWSQGWSPQWQVIILPLILLNFPSRDGILACLVLSLLSFVEYPVLFSRTGDTGGMISTAQLPLFTVLIIMRTLLLVGFAYALYRRLRTTPATTAMNS